MPGNMKRPKIVTICGSSRYVDIIAVCAWLIERDEKAIVMGLHLMPGWYAKNLPPDHLGEAEGVASEMDELHLHKIDMSHEVFIVNYGHHMGESTINEVNYAMKSHKKIRWFTHDEVGEKVRRIMKGRE